MSTFTLTVELGNAAMQTPGDVLEAVTESLNWYGADGHGTLTPWDEQPGERAGLVHDANGNRVGGWAVIEEGTPEQIAAAVLDAHAIQPGFNRTGEQVAALIAEAVRVARGDAR